MAYGGGNWNPPIQNKFLSGTYINFSSKARPTNIFSERGYVAFGMNLPWGVENELITVEPSDLQKNSLELFGLQYTAPELMPLREALKHAKTAYIYRLNKEGAKAKATTETMTIEAIYGGTGGNDLTVIVENNIENESEFIVKILKNGVKVFDKTVTDSAELKNKFVTFTGNLVTTVGTTLTGGTDGTVTNQSHIEFLEKLEKKFVNIVAYAGEESGVKDLYKSYVERRVNLEGAYLQGVLFDVNANSELIISVKSEQNPQLVYWVAGIEAGTEVNATSSSVIYNGELTPFVDYKQRDLEEAIRTGQFTFHEAHGQIKVLSDINTFIDFGLYKNEDFSKNQIIRVIHQVANDWSAIFNQYYLDKVQNDELGRTQLWNDFHNNALKLQALRAIQNLNEEDIIVELGETKDSVYTQFMIQPVLAMAKLYVEVIVA